MTTDVLDQVEDVELTDALDLAAALHRQIQELAARAPGPPSVVAYPAADAKHNRREATDRDVEDLAATFSVAATRIGAGCGYELELAIGGLLHANKSKRLTDEQRDQLLVGILRCHAAAVGQFSSQLRSHDAHNALTAALALVRHWGGDDTGLDDEPSTLTDTIARLSILKCELKRLRLEDMLRSRRDRRTKVHAAGTKALADDGTTASSTDSRLFS